MTYINYDTRAAEAALRRKAPEKPAPVAAPQRSWPHGLWPLTVFAVMAAAAIMVLL